MNSGVARDDAPARVLIIGGYGNFGGYIARALAQDSNIRVLIGGRSGEKAKAFAASLPAANPAEGHALDIDGDIAGTLAALAPAIVIHTTGPFQSQDYRVAQACIAQVCHYVDLADARSFVAGIGTLDVAARAAGVLVVSGASSVPCLTAAVIDDHLPRFARLDSVDYGISAAQQTNRGLATAASVLSYVGQPFEALRNGMMRTSYGWQDLHGEQYPELGLRLFGDCDIPDLALFPARYPSLRSQRFCAGHQVNLLHLGTWALSWVVRMGVIKSLSPYAERLLRLSFLFDRFGSGRSGFHMILKGQGHDGCPLEARFFMIARSGHGPNIPCIPAILLARRLTLGTIERRGATPCLDLITLTDYLAALEGLDISVVRS